MEMEHCPQCGGLVEVSHETRTMYRKGELFKERHTWYTCTECSYFEDSTESNKIANVNSSKRGYG